MSYGLARNPIWLLVAMGLNGFVHVTSHKYGELGPKGKCLYKTLKAFQGLCFDR
jgi:hypothetical protein